MMNNYAESKKTLDKIRSEYGCKGEVIFRTALQTVVEYGTDNLLDNYNYYHLTEEVNDRHDAAEAEGRTLWITRDFELAILKCAKEIASVEIYDMLTYIQREVWLSGDGMDYKRVIELLKGCMSQIEGDEMYEVAEIYNVFESIGFTDEEIEDLGFAYVLDVKEDEE